MLAWGQGKQLLHFHAGVRHDLQKISHCTFASKRFFLFSCQVACLRHVQFENTINICKPGEHGKTFTYDYVFTEGQHQVYDSIGRPMLADAFEGYNVCLFAYGQTGSGKTFSVQGEGADASGIIPRLCSELFAVAQERLDEDPTLTIKITMSYLEIYNEKVRDLLEKKRKGQPELTSLEIRETADKRVFVEGLSVHTVINYDRIEKLLEMGNAQQTGIFRLKSRILHGLSL